MKNQKGITAIVVLVVVLIVAVVGLAGYYVYNMQKDKNEPTVAPTNSQQDNTKNTANQNTTLAKEICTKDKVTCIKYPDFFFFFIDTQEDEFAGPVQVETITIRNEATGSELNYTSDIDGFGGGCMDGDISTNITKVVPSSNYQGASVVTVLSDTDQEEVYLYKDETMTPTVGVSTSCAYAYISLNQNMTNDYVFSLQASSANKADTAVLENMVGSFTSTH